MKPISVLNLYFVYLKDNVSHIKTMLATCGSGSCSKTVRIDKNIVTDGAATTEFSAAQRKAAPLPSALLATIPDGGSASFSAHSGTGGDILRAAPIPATRRKGRKTAHFTGPQLLILEPTYPLTFHLNG